MPEAPPHPARLAPEALLAECRMEAIRSAGPGGQHRNKVSTGVRLCHLPTGVQGMATERRSQLENKVEALFRLRLRLALDHRNPPRDEDFGPPETYRPSALWLGRLHGDRIRVNPDHADFPALLAEVLDRLAADADDLQRSAAAFRVSRSQLLKFLASEHAALGALNDRRRARGEHPLRAS
jgi:hypothetical protein